jgi:hypothetical protein
MTEELASVQRVSLRDVWQHEQTGLSRWLVDHIDILNSRLPFDIDPESLRQEAPAGAFSVDVVGEAVSAETGETIKVVIENQLEETDHRHLGQVLTYVAAYDADAAIWIAANARPEHAKAVQWLIDESTIDAWLFDIEVITIDGSRPAPLLTQIVGPSALSKKAKAGKRADEADKLQNREFWTVALPKQAKACAEFGAWQGRTPTGSVDTWQTVPNSPARIGWQTWVTHHGSWICLRVDGSTQEEADYLFKELQSQQADIEADFGGPLTWKPLEKYRASIIRWDNPYAGGYRDPEESWDAATDALADAMRRLVAATHERVPLLPEYRVASAVSDEPAT